MVNSSKGRRKGRKETRSIFILEFGHLRSKTHSPFRCPSWGHTATGSLIFLQQTQKRRRKLRIAFVMQRERCKKRWTISRLLPPISREGRDRIDNEYEKRREKEGGERNKETEKASRWKINAGHKFAPCLYKSKPRSR